MGNVLWHSSSRRLVVMALLSALCLSCQEKPATWESHWERGNHFYQQKEFVKAEAELKAALKLGEAGGFYPISTDG